MKDNQDFLNLLRKIKKNPKSSQRELADELGFSLGKLNYCLKALQSKGLVKIHQAPANRYFYYLTPRGFTEKSRLTTEYLSSSFDFYRKAKKRFDTI